MIGNNNGSVRNFGTRQKRRAMAWIFGGLAVVVIVALFALPLIFYGVPAVRPGGYYPFFFFPFGLFFLLFIGFFVFRLLFWGRGWGGGWGWGWRGGYYRGYSGWGNYPDAAEILRMRYAKGEITKEQFDQMMKDLSSQPTRPT